MTASLHHRMDVFDKQIGIHFLSVLDHLVRPCFLGFQGRSEVARGRHRLVLVRPGKASDEATPGQAHADQANRVKIGP